MKKICIFLATTRWIYFFLLGLLIGVVVFSQVANVDDMMPKIDNLFYIPIVFGAGFVQLIAMVSFYTEEERVTNEINGNIDTFSGLLRRDKYFPIKINTELSFAKRTCGYVYVIMARLIGTASVYFLCVILCGLATK